MTQHQTAQLRECLTHAKRHPAQWTVPAARHLETLAEQDEREVMSFEDAQFLAAAHWHVAGKKKR